MLKSFCQQQLLTIGKTGCYFLCLIRLCENITGKSIDILEAYEKCVGSGFMMENCFIQNPTAILLHYTHKEFEQLYLGKEYKNDGCDYVIANWQWKDGKETKNHFTIHTPSDPKIFEPFGNSPVSEKGEIISYRVFRKKK